MSNEKLIDFLQDHFPNAPWHKLESGEIKEVRIYVEDDELAGSVLLAKNRRRK